MHWATGSGIVNQVNLPSSAQAHETLAEEHRPPHSQTIKNAHVGVLERILSWSSFQRSSSAIIALGIVSS